jgi:hypothetical protein
LKNTVTTTVSKSHKKYLNSFSSQMVNLNLFHTSIKLLLLALILCAAGTIYKDKYLIEAFKSPTLRATVTTESINQEHQPKASELTSQLEASELTSQLEASELTSQLEASELTSQLEASESTSQLEASELTPPLEASEQQPFWVKLSPQGIEPYTDCSNDTFQHCCVGQCRLHHGSLKPEDVLWKWNDEREGARPLANLTDVLNYMESRKVYPEKSCNIFFSGDSTTSDHTMAATCQLTKAGYKLTSCNPKIGGVHYGNDTQVVCDSNQLDFPHFILENPTAKSCQKVVIVFDDTTHHERYKEITFGSSFQNGFVAVFSWGVHCNGSGIHNETAGKECLQKKLDEFFLPYVSKSIYNHWTFLFREHEPQHFNTKGGLFESGQMNAHKAQCVDTNGKAKNWRNEETARIISKHNKNHPTKKVYTIPLFDALEPLWQNHNSQLRDCTHYCYNPFRFDVTWDGMLEALKAHDNDKNANELENVIDDDIDHGALE